MISILWLAAGKIAPFLAKYWKIALTAAAVAALLLYVHHLGYTAGRDAVLARWNAEKAAAAKLASAALTQQQINTQHALSAAAQAEAQQQKIRVVYRTITKTVTHYVQTHPDTHTCGLDADGLRIWNAANRGSTTSQGGG